MEKSLLEEKNVYVEKMDPEVVLPFYANVGDAGMDVRASSDIILLPGETKVIPTGLKMHIPEGYEIQVRPRSGLSLKTPLRISNAPGTIDSGYKDEIGIIVSNTSPVIVLNAKQDMHTKEITYRMPEYPLEKCHTIEEKNNTFGAYIIRKNDRIAQLVLCKYAHMNLIETENGLIQTMGTNRGGGFGHSGVI